MSIDQYTMIGNNAANSYHTKSQQYNLVCLLHFNLTDLIIYCLLTVHGKFHAQSISPIFMYNITTMKPVWNDYP